MGQVRLDIRQRPTLTNPKRHLHCRSSVLVEVLYNAERVKYIQRSSLHSISMASEDLCGAGINNACFHTTPRHPQGSHKAVFEISNRNKLNVVPSKWLYPDGPAPMITTSVVDSDGTDIMSPVSEVLRCCEKNKNQKGLGVSKMCCNMALTSLREIPLDYISLLNMKITAFRLYGSLNPQSSTTWCMRLGLQGLLCA